ncbi:MAG: DUF645 family protein [Clostridia bacterium]|nr:DUF645 family protein [Clostridia bacterium]
MLYHFTQNSISYYRYTSFCRFINRSQINLSRTQFNKPVSRSIIIFVCFIIVIRPKHNLLFSRIKYDCLSLFVCIFNNI